MDCRDVQERITAYLDGDLAAPAASAFRGHLRTCAACRALAEDHAKLAAVLAELPPADPPPALWDGVLARLGEAETADARRSRWSLAWESALARLRRNLVPVCAVAAAAVVLVIWLARRDRDATMHVQLDTEVRESYEPVTIPSKHVDDIEVALSQEAQRIDQKYADAVAELRADVAEELAEWPAARRRAFEAELDRLQGAVDTAPASTMGLDADPFEAAEAAAAAREVRERAWQRLVAYLQRAVLGELEEARR